MEHDDLLQLLDIPQPQEFIDEVVGALIEAYRFNADRQEPDMGDDEQWFGFTVYRNSWFLIEERLSLVEGTNSARPNNSLRIVVDGGVAFHVYRGGNDEKYDIYTYDWNTGTKTKVSLRDSNNMQMTLFADTVQEGDTSWQLSELAIVHSGNADDGLTGVWVGAPVSEAADGSQWAWVLQVFSIDGDPDLRRHVEPDAPQRFSEAPEPDLDLGLRDPAEPDEALK